MKKTALLISLLMLVAFGLTFFSMRSPSATPSQVPSAVISATPIVKPSVGIRLVFSLKDMVSATVSAATPYEALTNVTSEKNISVTTKSYDFGVFVESIRGQKSSSKKAWIYFVNGQSGQVAADKQELSPGDMVEWKFTDVKN